MTDYNSQTCCNYAACPCPTAGMPSLQTGTGWRTPGPTDPGGVCCICDWESQKTLASPHKEKCYEVEVELLNQNAEVVGFQCYQANCCGAECDPEEGGQSGEWFDIINDSGCLTGRNWVADEVPCQAPESPDWLSEICSCGCAIGKLAYPCGEDSEKVFQPDTCECLCEKSDDDCDPGYVVDMELCECVLCETQPEDCVGLEVYNGEECKCECPENPCEETPATPDFVPPCSCDCIPIECDEDYYFVSNESYCGCEPCELECEGAKVPDETCTFCTGCPIEGYIENTYKDPDDGETYSFCCHETMEVCFDSYALGGPLCVNPCEKGTTRGAGEDVCRCACPNEGTVYCGDHCRPECANSPQESRHESWGCECKCAGGVQEVCNGTCMDPCPNDGQGKVRDPVSCDCVCPDGKETINCATMAECRDPCPEGETRQSSGMGTNCACHKCGDYDEDACGLNSTYDVFSCDCLCDEGFEGCAGECYPQCPISGQVLVDKHPFGCQCECQDDGFLGGIKKVLCEGGPGQPSQCVYPCPSHLILNQSTCECECEDSDDEECCITSSLGIESCSCTPICKSPLVRTIDGTDGGVSCKCKCPDPENQVVCKEDCLTKCEEGYAFNEDCECVEIYVEPSWLKDLIP